MYRCPGRCTRRRWVRQTAVRFTTRQQKRNTRTHGSELFPGLLASETAPAGPDGGVFFFRLAHGVRATDWQAPASRRVGEGPRTTGVTVSLTHQNTNSLIHSRAFLSGAEMVGFGGKPLAGLGCGFLGPLPWRIAICGAFFTGRGLGFSWSSPLTSPLLVARLNLTSGTGLPLGTWEMGIG